MEFVDISKWVIPQQILSFNYQTLLLFRCTQRKFARDFIQGKLFFNTPKRWIEEEQKGNKGQGDALEGTFFATTDDTHPFVQNLKSDPSITYFKHDGYTFFRRKAIENLPCICFYGLNSDAWHKTIDERGKVHWKTEIPISYFNDFSGGITREEYEEMDYDEQPVVLLINKPHDFFKKVEKALNSLGVSSDEIIWHPVEYLEKHKSSISFLSYPRELLIKDISFAAQKEIRIIINSQSESFQEYFKEHSNIIDVGDLSEFVDIQDYYFSNMEIERLGNKTISFSLPKPFTTLSSWYSLNAYELVQKYPLIYRQYFNDPVERDRQVESVNQFINEKYGITISYDGTGFKVSGEDPKLIDAFFSELQKSTSKIEKFNQLITRLLKEGKAQEAIKECQKARGDKELHSLPYSRELEIYQSLNDDDGFLHCCDYLLANDLMVFDTLNKRFSFYFNKKMYKEAFDDLNRMQDYNGYHNIISFNMGICLIHLCEYQKAVSIFSDLLKSSPDDPGLYYNRGVSYYKAKEFELAEKDMKKAIELDPDNQFYQQEFDKIF